MTCFYFQSALGAWFVPMALLTTLCALQFPLAWRRKMATPAQMQAQGIKEGIPLTGHGSTWTCLFVLNPLLSIFVAEYWHQWTRNEFLIAFAIGYSFSGVAHYVWTKAKYPEAHMRDGRLEPAGWAHLVYFGLAISLLVLIYKDTTGIPPTVMWAFTFYMVAHIWLGNHFVNRINKPDWFPKEYDFWALDAWIPVIFALLVLTGAAYWELDRRNTRMLSQSMNLPYVLTSTVETYGHGPPGLLPGGFFIFQDTNPPTLPRSIVATLTRRPRRTPAPSFNSGRE